eukprot:GHRQ01032691.1.p2 GENE.GHRQ01032691.1~~GHRQ01032691.1.p2  ORF type:complete len:156 (-),score=42.83 GHRQ01032691.1:112-579(-)
MSIYPVSPKRRSQAALKYNLAFLAVVTMPQQQGPGSLQNPLQLGNDTFRGLTAGSGASGLRSAFYGKTMGEVELQTYLLRVQSPISGSTLTAPNSMQHGTVCDPITGTPLRVSCGHAVVVTPVLRQEQVRAGAAMLCKGVHLQQAGWQKDGVWHK